MSFIDSQKLPVDLIFTNKLFSSADLKWFIESNTVNKMNKSWKIILNYLSVYKFHVKFYQLLNTKLILKTYQK